MDWGKKQKFSSDLPPTWVRARCVRRISQDKVECMLCPRACQLSDGESGICHVRTCQETQLFFTHYGRTTGLCIDPIEKKPLFHFLPGTPTLSFGTRGCNLQCAFCQNWQTHSGPDIFPNDIVCPPPVMAEIARHRSCPSVAMTYNDPVVFFEYAADVAEACHALDIRTIAITAGYISKQARPIFFRSFDAANVDLKAFTTRFYRERCKAELTDVLQTLVYIKEHTSIWLEITTLLIPEENDSEPEISALTKWIGKTLGPDVPLHFSAFHPDHQLLDRPPTPLQTLCRAREIAQANGLVHVYVGNCSVEDGGTTFCSHCQSPLITRSGYAIADYKLTQKKTCPKCQTPLVGHFRSEPGRFGNQRIPITLTDS